jgi:Na+-driven multidrug efflux pump
MGAFQPYNFFLSATGKGKYLRNTAIVLTVSALFFNLMLIPGYGAIGAAYATLISLFLDYLVHVYYYRKSLKESS